MPNFLHAFFLLMVPCPSEVAALISFISQLKKLKLQGVTTNNRLSLDLNKFPFYSKAQVYNHCNKPFIRKLWKDLDIYAKSSRAL